METPQIAPTGVGVACPTADRVSPLKPFQRRFVAAVRSVRGGQPLRLGGPTVPFLEAKSFVRYKLVTTTPTSTETSLCVLVSYPTLQAPGAALNGSHSRWHRASAHDRPSPWA